MINSFYRNYFDKLIVTSFIINSVLLITRLIIKYNMFAAKQKWGQLAKDRANNQGKS